MAKRNGVLLILLLALTSPATAAASTSNIGGQWTRLPPVPAGFNAVHTIVSPTGKVLLIAGSGRNDANFQAGNFRSYVWERKSPNPWRAVPTPVDLFCSGHVLLPDGRALVVGGTGAYPTKDRSTFTGNRAVYAFNFNTERYDRLAPLEVARWYDTALEMADGRTVIAAGKDETGRMTDINEVFDYRTNTHTRLPGVRFFPTYPDLHLAANGWAFYSGAAFSPTGNPAAGFWNPFTNAYRPVPPIPLANSRRFAASCFIGDVRRQQLMVMGGSGAQPATARTAVINLAAPSPTWREGPPLATPKVYLNCANLPDGSTVEVGGGRDNSVAGASREVAAIRDPAGQWAEWNPLPAGEHRVYHSLVCVLDSGQVVSMTSNPGSDPAAQSRSMLLFSPPYLFKGQRPTIMSAPTRVTWGGQYPVRTSPGVAKVAVTTYSSNTHSQSWNQRYLSLPMTNGTITMPANHAVLPPGWYRLSAVNAKGVPSVAWPIHIGGV